MDNNLRPLHYSETLSALYLIAPLFIFCAFFIRLEIAIPACAFILYQAYELIRRTAWQLRSMHWESCYFLALAMLWVWLSGGVGPLHQNGDWLKHYAIVNFLTQHPWPAAAQVEDLGEVALRYSIGWYLVPSLILKASSAHLQNLALSAWSVLGIFLLFCLLPNLVGKRRAAFIAPLVIMVFGGADFAGTLLTGFEPGPIHHFEWWDGWIQFSGNTTSLFWVPQHAIPAWLGAALCMRGRDNTALLPYFALLMAAILLWSPFSAIGLLPFVTMLAVRYGLRPIALDWRPIVATLLLALPIGLYLIAHSATLPSGFIGDLPCIWGNGPCFTWPSYALFLVLEVAAPLAILFLRGEREQGMLATATIALCFIPLYKIGIFNDFAMRASLPALAILAILCAKALVAGPKPYSIAILVVLVAALPTSIGEISRGILPGPDMPDDMTFATLMDMDPGGAEFLNQYFAPRSIWVLR